MTRRVFTVLVLVLFLSISYTTLIDASDWLTQLLPFTQPKVETYYIYTISQTYLDQSSKREEMKTYRQGENIYITAEHTPPHVVWGDSWKPEPSVDLFLQNYEVHITGTSEVAGRPCYVVEIVSKDSQQVVSKYDVDQKTVISLAMKDYNRNGELLYEFTSLEVDYDPNFNEVELDTYPIRYRFRSWPISTQELQSWLPWLNLNFELVKDYELIGISREEFFYSPIQRRYLEGTLEGESTPIASFPTKQDLPEEPFLLDDPFNSFRLWFSDGLDISIIEITADNSKKNIYPVQHELVEVKLGEHITMLVHDNAKVSLTMSSLVTTATERESLLLSLVPKDPDMEGISQLPVITLWESVQGEI